MGEDSCVKSVDRSEISVRVTHLLGLALGVCFLPPRLVSKASSCPSGHRWERRWKRHRQVREECRSLRIRKREGMKTLLLGGQAEGFHLNLPARRLDDALAKTY